MKKRKGFSMIELLATVTILGILSTVAIVSVQRILDKSTEEYYKEQENAMGMAAQSYYQNNRDKLPKSIGSISKIKLLELINANYIEQIKSKSKKNCSTTNSYVEVIKYSQTGYQYVVTLDCGSEYKTNNSRGTNLPDIRITMPTVNEDETVKNVTIKGNIQGDSSNNSKLISYSYVIYAAPLGTNRFQEVKNSGSTISRGKSKEISINVDQYLPAKIKVQITAINEHGKKKVVTSPAKEYKDIKYPLCPDDIDDTTMNIGSSKTWENIPSRTIKVICDDKEGVGCARPYFTQVFTKEAKTDVLKIQDRSGNEHTCRVNVYIDRNYPSLKVTLKNNSGGTINSVTANDSAKKNVESGWQGKKVTIAYSASDTLGLKSIKIQKSGPHKSKTATPSYNTGTTKNLEAAGYDYTETASGDLATVSEDGHTKFKITLTDISGKKVVVEAIVSYDGTSPELKLTNSSNSKWTKNDVEITAEHTDATSEITKLQYGYNNSTWKNWTIDSPTKTTGTWTAERDDTLYVRATDSAGNTTTKTTKVRIDKTKPTIKYSVNKEKQGSGSSAWYQTSSSSPFKVTITCTDSDSDFKEMTINSKTYTSSSKTLEYDKAVKSKKYTVSCKDKVGNKAESSASYNLKIKSRDPSCDCETWDSCPNSTCTCKTYKYTWKYRKCNRGTCKSCVKGGTGQAPSCNSPTNNTCKTYNYSFGGWTTKTGSSYPGNGVSSCTEKNVGKYNRQQTKSECTVRNSCSHSSCGCKTRKSCWHY